MPDTPPVVGVEYLAMAVRNSDGQWTRVFVTITDAQQRFAVRTVNDSARPAHFVLVGGAAPDVTAPIPSGTTNWTVGNRRFNLLQRFELQGA